MAEERVRVDRSLVAVPRARIRRRGNGHMARDVGTGVLYTALAGGVVALLANLDDIRNSKEVKDHWWLMPVGLIALGYMLRKRRHATAGTVIAVGGAMLALAYVGQQKAAQAAQQAPAPAGNDTAAPIGALQGHTTGFWYQAPDGRFLRLPHIVRRVAANA